MSFIVDQKESEISDLRKEVSALTTLLRGRHGLSRPTEKVSISEMEAVTGGNMSFSYNPK
jgi:hypothetical protein